MTTHIIETEIQTYNRIKNLRQKFWIFSSNYLKTINIVEEGDVVIFNVRNQVDLVRKVLYTEEISEGVVASFAPHTITKVAQAFMPKGGYTGSFQA